jgi:iron complex transport system ATP-binding protein
MSNEVYQLQNVNAGYADFQLKQINLTISANDFLGIIGPNGSGKSSLLKVLTKILPVLSGQLLFKGTAIKEMSYAQIAKTVAVVSAIGDIPEMSVAEYVMLGRIPHYQRFRFFADRYDQTVLHRSLALTGLTPLKHQSVDQISAGERQLANIARALCQEPEVLLLDEPTNFLDIAHQVQILDLLSRLNRQSGVTVIMISHDLNLAGQYCQQLVLLDQGEIAALGNPNQVLTYQMIEKVYKTVVIVEKSPISQKPYVFLIGEKYRQ